MHMSTVVSVVEPKNGRWKNGHIRTVRRSVTARIAVNSKSSIAKMSPDLLQKLWLAVKHSLESRKERIQLVIGFSYKMFHYYWMVEKCRMFTSGWIKIQWMQKNVFLEDKIICDSIYMFYLQIKKVLRTIWSNERV